MNFPTQNNLPNAQNLAQPFILKAQLADLTRSSAFHKDILGDIKTADEEQGGSPTGEARVLRDYALSALADLLGPLNNVIEALAKISDNSLVPTPKLRETVYEVVAGIKADNGELVTVAQYLSMVNASLNQMYSMQPMYASNATQPAALFALQQRVSGLTSLFSGISNAMAFLQHNVVVDDQGRAVIMITNQVVPYTVEEHPRAFFGNPRQFAPTGTRAAYSTNGRFAHNAGDGPAVEDLGAAAAANLTGSGLVDAASNAQALANGANATQRDPNAY